MTPLALVVILAEVIHPGASARHEPFLEAVARQTADADEAADLLEWADHESRFGEALAGRRWDAQAHGILQIRGPQYLERDEVASVGYWLRLKARAAEACGPALALAGLSSGACDRATKLAAARHDEAQRALVFALGVAWSRGADPS
jgi:hypothetical protein